MPALVLQPLLDAGQQRAGLRVVLDLERGAQHLGGLAVAVLAHERVAQVLPHADVPAVDGERGPGRRLRARPVPGLDQRLTSATSARALAGLTAAARRKWVAAAA